MVTNDMTEYANSVFEQPWWLNIVAPNKWHESIVRNKKDEVIARLVYVVEGKKIVMPSFTQTIGPWIREDHREFKRGNKQYYEIKAIINELLEDLSGFKQISFTMDSNNDYVLPYYWNDFKIQPSFSYRIKDLSNLEQVKSKFSKTVVQNIRSANKKVTIRSTNNIDESINLIKKTFEKQNRKLPFSEILISEIINQSIERNNGRLYTAYGEDGTPYSTAFLLYDDKVSYYLLGGTDPEYSSTGVQTAILWEAIRFSAEVSNMFDFEGSNIEGIENFMRQFGSDIITNYTVKKNTILYDLFDILKPRIKRRIGYKI